MRDSQEADTAEYPAIDDPLTRHFGPSPPPVQVTFGALSHPGLVRTNNEDHFLIVQRRRTRTVLLTNLPEGVLRPADDTAYVLAVADGMGGAAFGELASMLALRSGWEQSSQTIKWTWIVNDREVEELKERVELVFQRMNQDLLAHGKVDPACARMATTLTGVYTVGPEAFVGHVGDSRAYLHRDGTLMQLTRDHTLAQECRDQGLPIPCHSWHHKLTNCLGGGPGREPHVEFHHLQLGDGDSLLLCSDGLTDMVPDEEIARVLGRHVHPQETAQALVEAALTNGGRDNVTIILARYAM
jgi:protein phosphatase